MQHNDIDFGRLFICFWNIAVEQKLFISAKVAQMHKSIVLAEPALVVHESFVRQSGLGIVNGLFIFLRLNASAAFLITTGSAKGTAVSEYRKFALRR